jgi:hypothetical protein
MTERAEIVLQRLGLAYRVKLMSTRDMGFVQAKKYDLEVWAPGVEEWLEVSSVSNFRDYQARRMNIRWRPEAGAKPEILHTLNGSGLALARTVAALLEVYQQPDGSVALPDALPTKNDSSSAISHSFSEYTPAPRLPGTRHPVRLRGGPSSCCGCSRPWPAPAGRQTCMAPPRCPCAVGGTAPAIRGAAGTCGTPLHDLTAEGYVAGDPEQGPFGAILELPERWPSGLWRRS